MNKQQLKKLIKETLQEISNSDFKIGDRVEFTMTGTVKENRFNNNLLSVEMDNDEKVTVHVIDNNVKKLEF